jgi:hypothetical protein
LQRGQSTFTLQDGKAFSPSLKSSGWEIDWKNGSRLSVIYIAYLWLLRWSMEQGMIVVILLSFSASM